jgi:hypothetical protein
MQQDAHVLQKALASVLACMMPWGQYERLNSVRNCSKGCFCSQVVVARNDKQVLMQPAVMDEAREVLHRRSSLTTAGRSR